MAMSKRKLLTIILIAIALSVAYVLRWNIAPLQKKELKGNNPTSYTFSSDLNSIRNKLIAGFSIENQVKNTNVFAFKSLSRPRYARDVMLSLETEKDALFGKDIFKKKANHNDLYLHTFGDTITSHSYFALGKPLEYRVGFDIHFQPEPDGRTRIFVNAVNPTVIKGIGGIGAHGFYSNDIPVAPTTIEEYQLLRYIAYLLGENKMPPVHYPQ